MSEIQLCRDRQKSTRAGPSLSALWLAYIPRFCGLKTKYHPKSKTSDEFQPIEELLEFEKWRRLLKWSNPAKDKES